ncbi:MAG: hypothetical protein V4813_18315 [Gemmatimonadota bacterium]
MHRVNSQSLRACSRAAGVVRAAAALSLLTACADAPLAPSHDVPLLAPASAKLGVARVEQFANVANIWTTSALSTRNSANAEGNVVAFRGTVEGLPLAASQVLTITYAFSVDGHRAYDFLATTPDGSVTDGTTFFIPLDPHQVDGTTVAALMPAGLFRLTGGTITSVSGYVHTGDDGSRSEARISVTFTPTAPTATLHWGAHLASSNAWTSGGAAQVGNGNWQMRLNVDGTPQVKSASIQASSITAATP